MPRLSKLVFALEVLLFFGTTTQADTINFSGNIITGPLPAPVLPTPGRCPAMNLLVNIASMNNPSNLGPFSTVQSQCIDPAVVTPPLPFTNGIYTFTFSGTDSFSGTYSGVLTPAVTPGVFNILGMFDITGGTGMFLGASGSGTALGTQVFDVNFNVVSVNVALSATITTVPEPATMLLLSTGLAGIGLKLRKRRQEKAEQRR